MKPLAAMSRVLPRSYRARLMLAVPACTLLPMLCLVAWLLANGGAAPERLLLGTAIGLGATFLGTLLALVLIYRQLQPLRNAADLLERYRHDHRLPTLPEEPAADDEVGRLVHGIHRCLHGVDAGYRELERHVREDPLTRAMNRRGAQDALQASVQRAGEEDGGFVLFVVDLDNLKAINDADGHASGDRALVWLVQCAHECCLGGEDWIGRWGGDEFLIGMHADQAVARDRIELLVRVLAQAQEQTPAVRVSVGAAVWEPGLDAGELYRRADAAMYTAKSAGGRRVALHQAAGGAWSTQQRA